jgi:predicted TIM-barrel fold metal-dependent hydrolase
MIYSKYVCCVVLILMACNAGKHETATGKFYTVADFDSVRKIDTHIHLNTLQESFIHQAQKDNIRFLDIVDDRPFGIPMRDQEEIAIKQTTKFPQEISYATTFSTENFNDNTFQDDAIASLKKSFQNGAIAVKVWKNIGMALKDSSGKFVMIDDGRFDRILNFLEDNNIPLIGHLGEPRECWLPLDKMVLHKDYYSEHPEYHMYLHPEYPSYEKQIAARDNMLAKHPRLKFVGAHLGSLEWNLDELAKHLDQYTNMCVDLARMPDLFLHAKNDWQKTRDFFIRYQDRLLYATDVQVAESADTARYNQNIHDARIRYWTFFASDENMNNDAVGSFKALHLPASVIDKIYYDNARRWLRIFNTTE